MADVRLIDADKYPCQACNVSHCYQNCEKFVEWFNNTVDAVPVVHGRWEWVTDDIYKCSNCDEKSHVKEVMGQPDYNYCPNCGAKMDLEV